MSIENAFETGRLYKPLRDLADRRRDIFNAFMFLPGIHSFWPMSAIDGAGYVMDLAPGSGYRLSPDGSPLSGYDGVQYVEFDGAADYLWSFDSNLRDVTGTETYIDPAIRGLTLGGWYRHNDLTGYQAYIAKHGLSGQQSYLLQKRGVDNDARFVISNDGSTTISATSSNPMLADTWYFVVGRFRPGIAVDIVLNGAIDTTLTAWTSLFNSTSEFRIGASGGVSPDRYFNGSASLSFLCAAALPDSLIDNLYQISRDMFGV